MVNFVRIFVPLLLLTLSPLQSQAEDVLVATDTWDAYTNKDGTGFYLDVLKEVFPAPEYNLVFKFVPYKRATTLVEKNEADITTGVYTGDMADDKFLALEFIEKDSADLLLKKDLAKNWQGLKTLTNKNVAAKIGYSFDGFFEVPINYKEYAQLLGMMKMLGAGRVDAVIDYKNDIIKLWDPAGLNDDFTIIEGVIVNNAYFAFSTKSATLKKRFLETFPTLVKSGKILEIGLKYGLEAQNIPQ